MRRRGSLLLTVLVVLGIAVPGLLVRTPVAPGAGEARLAAAAINPAPAAQQRERDREQKQERERDRERGDRVQKRERADRQADADEAAADQNRAASDTSPPPVRGRAGNWRDRCSGPHLIRLPEVDGCTHGPDPAPPGFDVDRPVPLLSAQAANRAMASITCEGDGQSGYRVQVLYVHASDVNSRFNQVRQSIQGWAGETDQIFQDSAAKTGGVRNVRFVHDENCQPIVEEVEVSPAGDGGFGRMVSELEDQGFDSEFRIYLAFVDTNSAGLCGVGYIYRDERADGNVNWNNYGPGYARVDRHCWSGRVAAHEVMHNLGGVQLGAPNTSGGYHCVDEYDVMCYSDWPDSPQMRYDCPNPAHDDLLDCGNDDYFHTNPPAGSYLANFWNPANNRFLINDGPLPDDTTPPTVGVNAPGRPRAGTRIRIGATANDDRGVAAVAFGICTGANCNWGAARNLGVDYSPPFGVNWKVPKKGTFTFLARASDAAGNEAVSGPKTIKVKQEKKKAKRR